MRREKMMNAFLSSFDYNFWKANDGWRAIFVSIENSFAEQWLGRKIGIDRTKVTYTLWSSRNSSSNGSNTLGTRRGGAWVLYAGCAEGAVGGAADEEGLAAAAACSLACCLWLWTSLSMITLPPRPSRLRAIPNDRTIPFTPTRCVLNKWFCLAIWKFLHYLFFETQEHPLEILRYDFHSATFSTRAAKTERP